MWEINETKNYIFHHHKDSQADRDINEIMKKQEKCYVYICDVLKEKLDFKIKYYLCSSEEEIGSFFNDVKPEVAFATDKEVYIVYNDNTKNTGYHEDVHVISWNCLGKTTNKFIREGLATYFDKVWHGIVSSTWVKYYLKNDIYIKISDLIDNEKFRTKDANLTYPISGAFIDFLISVYGIDKFKEFYRQISINNDFEKSVSSIFKKDVNNLENKFINYISGIRIVDPSFNIDIYNILENDLKMRKVNPQ